MKFERIYDDNEIKGYKYGNYYIMKCYFWANNYDWIINQTGDNHYCNVEFWEEIEKGNVVLCDSLKDAKEKVKQLLA